MQKVCFLADLLEVDIRKLEFPELKENPIF